MDAGEQADEIILPAEREHRVDQVVADTCFALLDFEAVGEEIEEFAADAFDTSISPELRYNLRLSPPFRNRPSDEREDADLVS